MVELLLIISKFFYLLSATLTIGFLLAISFFTKNQNGLLRNENLDLRKKAAITAWSWSVSSALFIVATLASVLDVGIGSVLDLTMLRSFVTQISLGKFLAFQTLGALIVAIVINRTRRISYATLS